MIQLFPTLSNGRCSKGEANMKKKTYYTLLLLLSTSYFTAALLSKDFKFRPVPWVTHEAVLFLEEFMRQHPDAKVLEFGMGSSTIWFSKRTKHLTSVEHHADWHKKVSKAINETPECNSAKLILHARPYYTVCDQFPDETFDLILVDGRNRSGCIKYALSKLKRGGVLMLDNSERSYYRKALNLMKGWEGVQAVQKEPDSCGYMYQNWQTDWYFKP